MLDRFRDLVELIHDVVKELQAKAMAAEVDAGRNGPAARIVTKVKELVELIKVTLTPALTQALTPTLTLTLTPPLTLTLWSR